MEEKNKMLKITQGAVLRITDLLKNVDRSQSVEKETTHRFPSGEKITLQLKLNGFEQWIHLTHADRDNSLTLEYYVLIESFPTNKNSGERLYLVCPHSGKRSMNLYSFNGSEFRNREAFDQRVYYPMQTISRNLRLAYSINYLEKVKLPTLKSQVKKLHYKGRPTRPQERVAAAEIKLNGKTQTFVDQIEKEYEEDMNSIALKY
jgi:hypothetical protein